MNLFLLLNKLCNHTGYNLFSIEEVVGTFNELASEIKRKKLAKRLRVIHSFLDSDNKPEWMVVKTLPVSPC